MKDKYHCKKCKKQFSIPATYIEKDPDFNKAVANLKPDEFLSRGPPTGYEPEVHIPCCPFCYERDIEEKEEKKK